MLGRSQAHDGPQLAAARTRIAELERSLAERSTYDELTGVLTAPRFHARLDSELRRVEHCRRPLALALLDVDGFRALNASHGRAAGDRVLAAIGRALAASIRDVDVAGRVAADEFAVLMPETELRAAIACLEHVLATIDGEVEEGRSIGASVGIVACSSGQAADVLLGAAAERLQLARHAGGGRIVAGEDAATVEDMQQRDAISALAVALMERDHYTGEHSESVVEVAVAVARGLALDYGEVDRVRAAALLHDIGKVGIADEILNKPGPLTDDEWKRMKAHAVIGERILQAIPGMGAVARSVRHEHERWDGGGYPDGIAGEEIPIASRIILACDAYCTMTSDRSYGHAMSRADAIEELSRNAGTQFDPKIVGQLVGLLYGRGVAKPAPASPTPA